MAAAIDLTDDGGELEAALRQSTLDERERERRAGGRAAAAVPRPGQPPLSEPGPADIVDLADDDDMQAAAAWPSAADARAAAAGPLARAGLPSAADAAAAASSSAAAAPAPAAAEMTLLSSDDEVDDNAGGGAAAAAVVGKRKRNDYDSSTPFTCSICIEVVSQHRSSQYCPYSSQYVERSSVLTLSCSHRFCTECLLGLVRSKVTDKRIDQIVCPEPACRSPLTHDDVRLTTIGDRPIWLAWAESKSATLLEHEVSSGSGGMRRCPAERCNYTFAFELGSSIEGHKFSCPECSSRFCLGCYAMTKLHQSRLLPAEDPSGLVGPAHEGSCRERKRQLEADAREKAKLDDWRKQNSQADAKFTELLAAEARSGLTKPCPQCHEAVTKNLGCDHMSCRCGKQWNWSSGR
jgi:hypothetical protein|eukprot:COSAG06_NODE_6801_length_2775_cov_3.808670_1_plen_407_part_00